MDVTITQFRRDLFHLVEQAMNGVEVRVHHKGKRFTLKPEDPPQDRLSRITPMKIVLGDLDEAHDLLMKEMPAEWEKDWASFDCLSASAISPFLLSWNPRLVKTGRASSSTD